MALSCHCFGPMKMFHQSHLFDDDMDDQPLCDSRRQDHNYEKYDQKFRSVVTSMMLSRAGHLALGRP